MKNVNYNLIKMLHNTLDDEWRIHKFYIKDAKSGCKECAKIMERICMDLERHLRMLTKELQNHAKKGLK